MQTWPFKKSGHEVQRQFPLVIRWNSLPIYRSASAEIYRELPDGNLLVSGFDVILKHRR